MRIPMRPRRAIPNDLVTPGFLPIPLLMLGACVLVAGFSQPLSADKGAAGATLALEECVRQFESSYHNVRTLQASFTQEYVAWGRTRVESGEVYLSRGGKMRWEYQKPEQKLFLSDGREVMLYVASEKQLTLTPLKASDDVRVPLELLVSHPNLRRAFSKIEFAGPAAGAEPGDRVLRAYPRRGQEQEYRDVLVEITPTFDVRRLVITYPDETTMQFTFNGIARNARLNPSLFEFTPPAGTEVIQQ
jgi:outer membrane lipoprotein carrier protein